MKRKDLKTRRNQTLAQLKKEVIEKKRQAVITFAKIRSGQEKNTSKAKNLRRDIAQTLTVIREKELLEKENLREDIKEGQK